MIGTQKTIKDFQDGMDLARKSLEQYSLANPEDFQHIESACDQWLSDVEGLQKTPENQKKIIRKIWDEVQRIGPFFNHFSDWILARANEALKKVNSEGEFSIDGKNKIKAQFSVFFLDKDLKGKVLLLSNEALEDFGAKIQEIVSGLLISSNRGFCCFSCGDRNHYTVKNFPKIDGPTMIDQIEKMHGKIADIPERLEELDEEAPSIADGSLALGEFGDDEKSNFSAEDPS